MKSLTSLTPNLDLVSEFIKPEYVPDLSTTVGKLKHLRHVVERIPAAKFDMCAIMQKTECGSAGCMIGWAALDPSFAAMGLHLIPSYNNALSYIGIGDNTGNYAEVGEELLGITNDDADWLFEEYRHDNESHPITISHGLARIDRIIAKYSDL